jgi:hypothetical protein
MSVGVEELVEDRELVLAADNCERGCTNHASDDATAGEEEKASGASLDAGWFGYGALLEHELTLLDFDAHGVTLTELVLQEAQSERILDEALDRTL